MLQTLSSLWAPIRSKFCQSAQEKVIVRRLAYMISDSLHIAQTVYTQLFSRGLVFKDGKTIIKIITNMISSTTRQLPSSITLSCLILQQNSTLIRCNLWTSSMENSFAKTGKFRWTLAKNVLELCKETVSIFQYFQVKQSFRESKRTSCI